MVSFVSLNVFIMASLKPLLNLVSDYSHRQFLLPAIFLSRVGFPFFVCLAIFFNPFGTRYFRYYINSKTRYWFSGPSHQGLLLIFCLLICLETGLMSLTGSVFSLHCETSNVAATWSSLWSMEHAQLLWDGSDFGRDL